MRGREPWPAVHCCTGVSAEQAAIHPGKVLLDEVMAPLGVSRAQLARDLDVPIGRLRAIVLGQHAITADMALRLAKHFGTTPELWMKLQADYDLATARAAVWPTVEPRIRVFGEEPEPGDAQPEANEPTHAAGDPGERIEPYVALPEVPLREPEPDDRIEPFVALPEESPAALGPDAPPKPVLVWPSPPREPMSETQPLPEERAFAGALAPARDPFPPAEAVPPLEADPSADPLPASAPLPPVGAAEAPVDDELPVLELTERVDPDEEEEPLELTERVDPVDRPVAEGPFVPTPHADPSAPLPDYATAEIIIPEPPKHSASA
jgi:addiction module HigA family antidote